MTKLDKIEATFNGLNERYPNDPEVVGVYAVKRMGLLIRAVRQLGEERGAFQALFEAVDNDYKTVKTHAPEVYGSFLVVTNTAEADPDVLKLIEK